MKILQLCNKVPYPAKDGGAIAMLNLSKSFAELGHKVTVLAMNTPKHNTSIEHIPETLKSAIEFQLVPVDTNIRVTKLLLNLFFSQKPYNAERFINKHFESKLIELVKENSFDIIQLEGHYLLPYIPVIRSHCSALISLRAHNVESEIWSRIKAVTANPLKKFYFGIISKRLADFETKMLNTYDILVPITERDAATFKGLGNSKPMVVIPTGISEQIFKQGENSTDAHSKLFFIGALDWIPNQEGLVWFIEKVWPQLLSSIEGVELHVAGRNAPAWIEKKYQEVNVHFHGEVEDAYQFMESHDIMIVPLFAGSGMRIKIIEAMARSKVVVTTDIGAEGLGVQNNKHLLIGNSVDEFVNRITKLIMDQDFFGKIQENAFVYTQQFFNNKELTLKLTEFYKKHCTCWQ
jgi:glycosyltransferase involved in cell wall biosynthesis